MVCASQLAPSDYIRALVCCYPHDIRVHRLMLMLQGYVDDSGSDAGREPFVLAGFIMGTEGWAAFSDDWQAALRLQPRIEYFKMHEAAGREGQFFGMRPEFVRCKINDLLAVLAKHDPKGIYCFMDWSTYRKIAASRGLPQHVQTPYHFLFPGIFDCIRLMQINEGIFPEPIDVDFDEQGKAGQIALQTYPFMKANCDPDIRQMLGRLPIMLDDKKVMPLQAADMLAWNVRREHDMDEDGVAWHWVYAELEKHIKVVNTLREETLAPSLERFPLL